MNFKKIEMVGFKSFADPIKISFENGITAIVGPNGCGKSNVADAIRWVLGEQSSKLLRGTNMQDVIFKGTEKRKSLSFCEVTLLFDNTNKIFKSEYDEIAITRKLYRSGESEYMLNRTACRLKDIVDLLHDSGIGKSGYSIIGQGKVDEIINSKPVDRRAIFEEAAGIAKFKAKKIDAERKLDRTHDNLTRINDIVSEIDRQLKPLRHQAEVAKKYLELKEQLKVLEVNAYIYQHDYAASNKAEIETKINAIMEELNLRQDTLDKVIENYNISFNKINTIDEDIRVVRDEILNLTVSIEKQAGQSNLIREKLRNSELENVRLSEEKIKVDANLESFSKDLENAEIAILEKQNKLNKLIQELEIINSKFITIDRELKSNENASVEAQRKMFEELSKLGDVKAQISALKAEKLANAEQLESSEKSYASVLEKLKESKQNFILSNKLLDDFQQEQTELEVKVKNLQASQNESMETLKSVEIEINTMNSNIISMQHRKKMLEDMQKEYEGFGGSVKRLLTDANNNDKLKSKIVGVIASLIKVPQNFETAVEMALGNAVQNVVTYDDDGAKQLITYLKEKEYGRVTFLPISTVKPRYFDKSLKSSLNISGCYGIAADLISFDARIENVISSLLGTTVIVDQINTAVALAKKSNYSFRIVTLDGDLINPQGSITGGSKKAQVANLLSRESNIDLARQTLTKLNLEVTKKRVEQTKLVDDVNRISANLKSVEEVLHNCEIKIAAEKERSNKYQQITMDLEFESNGLQSGIARNKQMIETVVKEIAKLENSNNMSQNTSNNFEASPSEFSELRSKRDEYANELTNLKVEQASLNSEIVAIGGDIERLKMAINTNTQMKSEIENGIRENNALLLKYKNMENVDAENVNVNGILASLNVAKDKLSALEKEKNGLQSSLRTLEEERMNLSTEVSRLQDKKYQQDLNLSKIDTDIEALQERVYTEYELTYSTAQDYKKPEFDVKQGLIDINKLKREINGLGNVNVNAIEDSKLLEERHGNLYVQAQDLIHAEEDLKKIIKELSCEMVSRFKEEFDKINDNFGVVFKELFGGGSAKLQLVESEDLLEAGVDIIAEPPGKKLSNITLLSGGEKALTAIAILFSILRLRPMPFCLLDEIEAPLDEANVARFAKYLKRYSNETQFIVITHKKTTMEHADALYGVTMEEKGVSKIVSVKLTEAIKNVEEK